MLELHEGIRVEAVADLFTETAHEPDQVVISLRLVIAEAPVYRLVSVVLDFANEVHLRRLLVVDVLVKTFEVSIALAFLRFGRGISFTGALIIVDFLIWLRDATGSFSNRIVSVVLSKLINVDHYILLR